MTSNDQVPMEIPANDRRFNVAFSQPLPLRAKFGNSEFKLAQIIRTKIPKELPEFYRFLMKRTVKRTSVGLAIDNSAKRHMISAGRTATQAFFDMLRSGDTELIHEEYLRLQNKEVRMTTIMENPSLLNDEIFKSFQNICTVQLFAEKDGTTVITREQLAILARCMLGKKIPTSPNHYIAWLAQFGFSETTSKCVTRNKKLKGVPVKCRVFTI